jgi:CheY-like chemotaxis protein
MRDDHEGGALSLRGLRVLVVEDAPPVVNALQNFLEDFGIVIAGPVSTPDAAEKLLDEQPIDLALVDMHLDGHIGYALVERMRQGKVPVVAISGSAELPEEGTCVATLQKPFSGQELLATLHRLVAATSRS